MGVESHSSSSLVDLSNRECIKGDCKESFGMAAKEDTTYIGSFQGGLPHGVGVLGIGDTLELVSKFSQGYVVGTGFVYNQPLSGYDKELFDGEEPIDFGVT